MKLLSAIAGLTAPSRPVGRGAFLWIAASVLILDQATKFWAVAGLLNHRAGEGAASLFFDAERLLPYAYEPALSRTIEIIPNYFALLFRVNTGAAFSLFSEHTGLLALFSAAISLGFVIWAWRLGPAEQGLRVALGLILGGAVGNLIDRVRLRYVIDFLHAHWQWEYHWPTFNVADSAVCVGMALLVIGTLRLPHPHAGAAAPPVVDSGAASPSAPPATSRRRG